MLICGHFLDCLSCRYINALAHGLVDPSYYVTWFGEQDMNRQQEVAATLDNMVTNDFLTFTYNCGVFAPDCGAGDVAYVDPQVCAESVWTD